MKVQRLVSILLILGIQLAQMNKKKNTKPISLNIRPNPFSYMAEIRLQITDNKSQLKIYDISGRLVKSFNHLTNSVSTVKTIQDKNCQMESTLVF
jgi:hypothetical protein